MAESPDQPSCGSNVLSKFNKGYYDGNIRNQYWKSSVDGVQRAYEYTYDGASRLNTATYASTKAGENYALNSVSYDKNGNITALNRNGATTANYSSFGNVDNLTYTYQSNSNKVLKVTDATTGNTDLGDFRDNTNTDNDYAYWIDGSLKKDKNKKITLITYNYLKLPAVITFDNTRTITTEYDAAGTKLKKIDSNGEVTDYEEDDIYVNSNLYQSSHQEGRIANGIYEYNITDHLGNLRVSFRDSSGIAVALQSIFYDPWGLTMKGMQVTRNPVNFNKHQFLNRETQFETGYIDLIHRQFDPQTGRFTSIDPLSEKFHSHSLYNYGLGNPIRFIDPDGAAAMDVTLLGANNSSVTVKTDLIDIKVNASGLGVNFGGNYTLQGDQLLGAALDIVGIFDPTGIADAAGARLAYKQGDYLSAGISALGVVPYAGDVAKVGKIEKDVKIIGNAVDALKGAENAKGGIYALKDANGVVKRTGRTGDLAGREAQHKVGKETKGLEFDAVYKTDNYAEQRGLEHMLYDTHKGTAAAANGGLNKIKAIGDKNLNKPDYLKAAAKYLGKQ